MVLCVDSCMIDEGKIAKSQNRVEREKNFLGQAIFHAYHPRNDDITFHRVRGVVLQFSTYISRRECNSAHASTDCYFFCLSAFCSRFS